MCCEDLDNFDQTARILGWFLSRDASFALPENKPLLIARLLYCKLFFLELDFGFVVPHAVFATPGGLTLPALDTLSPKDGRLSEGLLGALCYIESTYGGKDAPRKLAEAAPFAEALQEARASGEPVRVSDDAMLRAWYGAADEWATVYEGKR